MPKVLVVEDEPANVEILRRLLERNKYSVLVAHNKDDAVAMATAESPDLILMDIGIPNSHGEDANRYGGVEATRIIKAEPSMQTIPIIAITASAMIDERKRFLEAGCDAVQTKPFEFTALLETIKRYLAGQ